VYGVTPDVAASASYSSAPPKSPVRDPSPPDGGFASLLDSNFQSDPSGPPAQGPDPSPPTPPAPQTRNSASDRSSRDSTSTTDQTPPGRPDDSSGAQSGGADATDSNTAAPDKGDGRATTAKSDAGKSAGKTKTDKTASDKTSADDTSASGAASTTSQDVTPLTALNAAAAAIPGTADPANRPAASPAANDANTPLAIAAAAIAGSAATGATAPPAPTGFGLPAAGATTQDKPATVKTGGESTPTSPSATQTAASIADATTADDTALPAADAAPAKTATGLKNQTTASTKASASAKASEGTLETPAPWATAPAESGRTVQQPGAAGPEIANNALGDTAKTPGLSLQSSSAPSSHGKSSILATAQASAPAVDASAQAAAALPQQMSSVASTTQAGPVSVTQATGAPVPVSGLAVEIAAFVQSGKTRFEVRLDPADLGRIDVRIDVDRNGQVTSHLTVEKPETLSMLRQDAPQLQQALNDAGLKTNSSGLQFSLRDQSSSGQNNGNNNQPGAQPQRLIVSDEETVPSLVVGRSYGRAFGSSGGVDIRV